MTPCPWPTFLPTTRPSHLWVCLNWVVGFPRSSTRLDAPQPSFSCWSALQAASGATRVPVWSSSPPPVAPAVVPVAAAATRTRARDATARGSKQAVSRPCHMCGRRRAGVDMPCFQHLPPTTWPHARVPCPSSHELCGVSARTDAPLRFRMLSLGARPPAMALLLLFRSPAGRACPLGAPCSHQQRRLQHPGGEWKCRLT